MGEVDIGNPLISSMLRIVIGVVVGVPLVLYPLLYFLQDAMLFFPRPIPTYMLEWTKRHFPDTEVNVVMPDGVRLHGWFVKPAYSKPAPLLIYYGGNAEEVSQMLSVRDEFSDFALLLMNYRAYGLSDGKPGEQALFSDALTLFDQFSNRDDINTDCIVLMGRSLGSTIAVYVASNRPVTSVMLITPIDSVVNVAKYHYPYVPVSMLLKYRFDALSLAPRIKVPLLAVIAADDEIVPNENSMRLVNQWGGPKKVVTIAGKGHNDVSDPVDYWQSIRGFLGKSCMNIQQSGAES